MAETAYFGTPKTISLEIHGGTSLIPQSAGGTMLRLRRAQRTLLAETLRDIANIAAGAMIFGQFLADAMFSTRVAFGGMALWVVLVVCAILLASEGQRS